MEWTYTSMCKKARNAHRILAGTSKGKGVLENLDGRIILKFILNKQTTRCHNPEQPRHSHRRENPKSHGSGKF
jgi:hypothetical protein